MFYPCSSTSPGNYLAPAKSQAFQAFLHFSGSERVTLQLLSSFVLALGRPVPEVPMISWTPLRSLEQLGPLVLFVALQLHQAGWLASGIVGSQAGTDLDPVRSAACEAQQPGGFALAKCTKSGLTRQ